MAKATGYEVTSVEWPEPVPATIKTILLDMDGVCCDFVAEACRWHGIDGAEVRARWVRGTWDICEPMGIAPDKFWEVLAGQPRFWRFMPPYSWFKDLIYNLRLRDAEVIICTSPSRCPSSHYGKAAWLYDRDICPTTQAVMTHRKELLARPDVVLIDDSDRNVRRFREAGGQAILWPQIWNELHAWHGDRVLDVSKQLSAMGVRYRSEDAA